MSFVRALSEKPSSLFVTAAAAAVAACHLILWLVIGVARGTTLPEILTHWDSGHFSAIVTGGYSGARWAFYPLYPLFLKGATWTLNLLMATPPQVAGAIVSTVIFGAFVWLVASSPTNPDGRRTTPPHTMAPLTRAGWMLFLLSPASYVFQSNHTESLFVLLTFCAFSFSFRAGAHSWILAAVFAGLAALTRNHGVLAAVVVAMIAASKERTPARKFWRFSTSGLISAALFGLFPLFQFVKTGNPLQFVQAHENWNLPSGPGAYFATFWFGNPMQNTRPMSILHHAFVGLLIWSCWLWWKRYRPVAAYISFFILLMPAQLEFVDAFRFGAVLWPVFFLLGDLAVKRLPAWGNSFMLAAAASLNVAVTVAYGLGRWAY
ncbi:MAG: hypothetical protein RIQ81_1245 [Pseudomonadota bacterium]